MKQLNKYFVFSDVHGEYKDLLEALQDAGYEQSNPTHKLVSVGDAFDRGPDSRKIFELLRRDRAICVKGNHDFFLEEFLDKGLDGEFVLFNILHNGLGATISSFAERPPLTQFKVQDLEDMRRYILNNYGSNLKNFIKGMPLYYETEHFVFVHAGINPNINNWKETDEHYMTWDIEDSHLPCNNVNKFVVIGHHHASRIRRNAEECGFRETNEIKYSIRGENGSSVKKTGKCYGNKDENAIYVCQNKIALDGCTNLTHKVNILVIEDYEKDEPKETERNIVEETQDWGGISYATSGRIYTTTTTVNTGFRS